MYKISFSSSVEIKCCPKTSNISFQKGKNFHLNARQDFYNKLVPDLTYHKIVIDRLY